MIAAVLVSGFLGLLFFCEDGSYSVSYDEEAEARGVARFMAKASGPERS